MVLTFQKWWFRPQQQRLWKTTEKIWKCRIAGIAGRILNSNPKTIGESIRSWPGNYFQKLACHWKDPDRREIGAVRIKRKRHWKAKNYLWNFVWSFQKKVMGRHQPTINITTSTQYSWKEAFAVYLVESEGSCVLRTAKIWWNGYWWSLPITINKIEPSVEAKTTRIGVQNTQSNFGGRVKISNSKILEWLTSRIWKLTNSQV